MAESNSQILLRILRSMPETQIHTEIVKPLLHSLGFTNVTYVHHPHERGKDFIYISEDRHKIQRLCVCQVKNKPITGRATDKDSFAEVANQLLQCAKYEVINPITSKKETPWEVSLYTTYPIPDAATADAGPLLDTIASYKVTVIGPDHFTNLIEAHLPDKFARMVYPEHAHLAYLRAYVDRHHEALAFDSTPARPLSQLYIPMDMTPIQEWSELIAELDVKQRGWHCDHVNCSTEVLERANCILQHLPTEMCALTPFEVAVTRKAVENYQQQNGIQREGHINTEEFNTDSQVIKLTKIHAFLRTMSAFEKRIAKAVTNADRIRLIRTYLKAGELIETLLRALESQLRGILVQDSGDNYEMKSEDHDSPGVCTIGEMTPELVLDLGLNLIISGSAGAGKTTFARSIARTAIDRKLVVIYFPCHRIIEKQEKLTTAIEDFLVEVCRVSSRSSAKVYIETADLIILDGCDEAASYGRGLEDEIVELCHRLVRLEITKGAKIEVPEDLCHLLRLERTKSRGDKNGTVSLVIKPNYSVVESEMINQFLNKLEAVGSVTGVAERMRKQNTQFIVTIRRDAQLSRPANFVCARLRRFSPDQVKVFFRRWCAHGNIDVKPLLKFVRANPQMADVCRTPLTASILAGLHEKKMELPPNIVHLYAKRFELLLSRWDMMRDIDRSELPSSDKELLLCRLAYSLHCKHIRSFSFGDLETIWNAGFARKFPTMTVEDVIYELLVVNSVIERDGRSSYSLGHLSFQEFLAAKFVMYGQKVKELSKHINDVWWQCVVFFFVGMTGDATALLNAVRRRRFAHIDKEMLVMLTKEARYACDPPSDSMGDWAADS
jgi:hypothetical protein